MRATENSITQMQFISQSTISDVSEPVELPVYLDTSTQGKVLIGQATIEGDIAEIIIERDTPISDFLEQGFLQGISIAPTKSRKK